MATKRAAAKASGKGASSASASLDFAFFRFLWQFHKDNRGKLRQSYRELTRKYLDFNNPDKNPKAFLRQPQFEALETYVFLKEFLDNAKVEEIFKAWYERSGKFEGRKFGSFLGNAGQEMFQFGESDELELNSYKVLFEKMRKSSRAYPNYIFALTMGTGKTILMATCIFYEFLLANKFPKDAHYCHNALVFAPDKTVLQSLKEIESFDLMRVVPPEYVNFLTTHLRFHYLEEAGTSLDTLDRSRFNIVVSNTQKIILKRQHKEKTPAAKLFASSGETLAANGVYADAADLYNFDQPEEEGELTTNQRFEKLRRLEQLGIYVDEAHHAFGKALAKDMGVGAKETDTSLRTTIDILAASLNAAGTRVVACYNYTGTPYVGREVLPEVVYAYGLKEAIDKGFLKKVTLHGYANTRTDEFVDIAIENFLKETDGLRPEGLFPEAGLLCSHRGGADGRAEARRRACAAQARHPDLAHPGERGRQQDHYQRRHPRIQPTRHRRLGKAVHPAGQQGPRRLELPLAVRCGPVPRAQVQGVCAASHDALPTRHRRGPAHGPRLPLGRQPQHAQR